MALRSLRPSGRCAAYERALAAWAVEQVEQLGKRRVLERHHRNKLRIADQLPASTALFDDSRANVLPLSRHAYFARPASGLPTCPRDYGALLKGGRGGKHRAEAALAANASPAPVHIIANGVVVPRRPARSWSLRPNAAPRHDWFMSPATSSGADRRPALGCAARTVLRILIGGQPDPRCRSVRHSLTEPTHGLPIPMAGRCDIGAIRSRDQPVRPRRRTGGLLERLVGSHGVPVLATRGRRNEEQIVIEIGWTGPRNEAVRALPPLIEEATGKPRRPCGWKSAPRPHAPDVLIVWMPIMFKLRLAGVVANGSRIAYRPHIGYGSELSPDRLASRRLSDVGRIAAPVAGRHYGCLAIAAIQCASPAMTSMPRLARSCAVPQSTGSHWRSRYATCWSTDLSFAPRRRKASAI